MNSPARLPTRSASVGEMLIAAGLAPAQAGLLDRLPQHLVRADMRRAFRETGGRRDEVLFVQSGLLALFKADTLGTRIVALRFPGETILPRETSDRCGIQALVPSEVLIMEGAAIERLAERHQEVRRFFWRLLRRDQAIAYQWLLSRGRRDSRARTAHLFCETAARLGHRDGRAMVNPFTQQQIGNITAQTSVNVNRVLLELDRDGLIERDRRMIGFPDWAEFQRVAGFNDAYLRF